MALRVLVLNERDPAHPAAGGAEVHLREIFSRLAGRGDQVTLLASSFAGSPATAEIDGLVVRRLGRLPLYYPRVALACRRETRAGRIDVVVECLNKVPFYSPLYARAPVVALCHHLFGSAAFYQVAWPLAAAVWLSERPLRFCYRRQLFVTISASSRDDLVRRGIAAAAITVVHCGVRQSEAPVPSASSPARVVYHGRLEPYKRVDLLLRALASPALRDLDAELVVVGRGSAQPRLEALARRLGVGARVRFTGFVSDEERSALVRSARVAVCPSRKEGWGLTVLEANALGVPVVASDVPGLRDSVRDGETGFLVAAGDVGALAARVAQLLRDDELAARMSRAARAWAMRFSWEDAAQAMAETLEAVVKRSRAEMRSRN